jgi:DNA-binding NarL/FixJ family response regulator
MSTYAGGVERCGRIRVLLVDDHALIREGVRRLLEADPDVEVVGEAASGEAAIAMLDVERPDLVLMDVRMPGMGGLEATRVIRSTFPNVRVVILSAYSEYAAEAVRAGAWGYLLKTAGTGQLLATLRSVFYGAMVLHEPVAAGLSLGGGPARPVRSSVLSPRELEVLRLLVSGLTNRAIAHRLGIGPRTADQHVHSIFVKIGARSRAEAVLYAIEHQLAGTGKDLSCDPS